MRSKFYTLLATFALVWTFAFFWKPCSNKCLHCFKPTKPLSVTEKLVINRAECHADCGGDWKDIKNQMGIGSKEYIARYGEGEGSIIEEWGIKIRMPHAGQKRKWWF